MFKTPLKPPDEFVCDGSKALLKAIASAFADCDGIETYINRCVLSLETGSTPPKCQIRLDRSHFIKNVTKKIKYRDFRKCNFYRCIIGFLIKCDKFDVVKEVVYDLFTVLRNENDGMDEFGELLPAESSRMRLINLIDTHDETIDYENETSDWRDDLDFRVSTHWIHDIIQKVPVKKANSGHLNLYYDKEGEETFIQILSTIPLWSNIMNESFGSTSNVATSSDVESSFNSLKNGILAGKVLPVHTFLQSHIEFVNAEIKLNAISNKNPSIKPPKRSRSLEQTPKKLQKRSLSLDHPSSMRFDTLGIDELTNSDEDGNHFSSFLTNEKIISKIYIVYSLFDSRRRKLAQQKPSDQSH